MHRDHEREQLGGEKSSLEILTPLFYYGGLIVLIVIGIAR